MSIAWIPDAVKQQIYDAVVNFVAEQAKDLLGQEIGDRVRNLTSKAGQQRAIDQAVERAIKRFEKEYVEIDEDLAAAILADTHFWQHAEVRAALINLVQRPGIPQPIHRDALVAQFEGILPSRRNRERVDRAISYLLRCVAEEVWSEPGAREVREIYLLQTQRITAEAAQQQIALLREQIAATKQIGVDLRQALIGLTGAVEQRLLTSSGSAPSQGEPRPLHNLPQRNYSRFIGRSSEIERLQRALLPYPQSRHFLMTVDGIGGVGKSTLVLELAHHYREQYNTLSSDERFEAIVWVSAKRSHLSGSGILPRAATFSTLADLFRAIAVVLDEPTLLQEAIENQQARVTQLLAHTRALLVIDNLETVDDQALITFLGEVPEPTKVIITTRHRIDASFVMRLTGMPKEDALALMAFEAARKAIDLPIHAVEDLFRRTGGVPLAIVWSIGLISLGYTVETVIRRLGSSDSDIARFCFKESVNNIQGRDAYKLLMALSLLDMDAKRDMIGTIAGLSSDVIGRDDGLAELLQLSLVNQIRERYVLLPLTRSFALDVLRELPALEQELRDRWIEYLTQLALPFARPRWLRPGRYVLHEEGGHFTTLAVWAEEADRPDVLLPIIPALTHYYDLTGQWSETVRVAQKGLTYARLVGNLPSTIFILTYGLAWVLRQQGQYGASEQYIKEALAAAQQLGDAQWQCEVLVRYSQVLRAAKAYERAKACCTKVLELLPSLQDMEQDAAKADVLYELGKIERDCGNWSDAERYFLAARGLFNHGDSDSSLSIDLAWGVASNLGLVASELGKLDLAEQYFHQALGLARQTGGRGNLTTLLVRLAHLETKRGNKAQAKQYLTEASDLAQRLGMVKELEQIDALHQRIAP